MISAIIITKNEQEMISDCIKSVKFADEIVVVDTGNTDATNSLAKALGARVVVSNGKNYSDFRNDGIRHAKGDWLLFVDADERISPPLANEIKEISKKNTPYAAFYLQRKNNYLGKFMSHGGWEIEKIPRLFKTQYLEKYIGDLHEEPIVNGRIGTLSHLLLHYSHRDLDSMVKKTIFFTKYETENRLKINHPMITSWRIWRVMATEFFTRFIKKSAWMDGTEGVIDGMFQVFNTYIIYARLWEAQNQKK